MNCEESQPLLSAYLDGQLDEAQRRAVEAHLASCARCRADEAALGRVVASVARLPAVEPPPGFSQRVMAHVREEAHRPALWRSLFLPAWPKIPLHVAGALLLGGLAVYLFQASQPLEPVSPAPGSVAESDTFSEREAESTVVGQLEAAKEAPALEHRLPLRSAPREKSVKVDRLNEAAGLTAATRAEQALVMKKVSPLPAVDYELTLALKETTQETFKLKFHELIKKLNGQIIETAEPAETAWLLIPAERYDQLKQELASFGAIESEARIVTQPPSSAGAKTAPPAAAMSPEPRSLRIKLTIRPPQ